MGILDFFQKDRSKKIAQGSFGTIYAPNYACPNFEKRKGYISKMMKSKKDAEYEISQLKIIKKIDPNQEHLATFETSCVSSQRKYNKNIIMKNFGNALILKKYKRDRSYDHVINVFMKQMLEALILLHKNGIYHKDIHERNTVYSEEENRYRLIDFGLSTSNKDINEVLKLKNIKKAKNLSSYFDSIIVRGDGMHETFDFEGYRDLEDIMYSDETDISKLKLKKLTSGLKKAHEDADISILLIMAPHLAKGAIKEKIEKIMDKLEKGMSGKMTAKYVHDKLFKKQTGGKKKKTKKVLKKKPKKVLKKKTKKKQKK
jgi:tRNA A-37 threonylcarbamoyl transferase component Bud32